MKRTRSQDGERLIIAGLIGAVCFAAVVAVILAVRTLPGKPETVRGDFTPPPFEPNAVYGVPEVDESLGWSEISVRPGYIAHVCGVLRTDGDGYAAVWFSSEEANEVWIKLRVKGPDGELLGETGILRPGEYVERIRLADGARSGAVTLLVMGYEPETYYSAGAVSLSTTLTVADNEEE